MFYAVRFGVAHWGLGFWVTGWGDLVTLEIEVNSSWDTVAGLSPGLERCSCALFFIGYDFG